VDFFEGYTLRITPFPSFPNEFEKLLVIGGW